MRPIHPIPSGTRDVLADEMRELRAISGAMRTALEDHGYAEVYTPAIEYESEVGRLAGGAGAYRLFDDHGSVLQLRSDLTVPIARVATTRYADVEPPLRFCAVAHVYRAVRPHRGQMREELQVGAELIGSPGPEGTVEVLTVLCRALDAAGLRDYRVGLGDAALYPELMVQCSVPEEARSALLAELATRDFVGLERRVRELGLGAEETDRLVRVPQARGGREVLDAVPGPVEALRALHDRLAPEVAERVIFDLGLVRQLGYYTGAVFEVYDPALGAPIGRGGRYDDLLGRFGRPLPAVGFALGVDRLHIALHGEERAR
jgi:ATP phosphoribosyltransferase regulatory subunit